MKKIKRWIMKWLFDGENIIVSRLSFFSGSNIKCNNFYIVSDKYLGDKDINAHITKIEENMLTGTEKK